jgi:hypothetical protein
MYTCLLFYCKSVLGFMSQNCVLGENSIMLINKNLVVPIQSKVLINFLLTECPFDRDSWYTKIMCLKKAAHPLSLNLQMHAHLTWEKLKTGISIVYIKPISFFLVKNIYSIIKVVWKSCLCNKWEVDYPRPQHIPSISWHKSIIRACTFIHSKWKFQEVLPHSLFHCNQCSTSDIESILIVQSLHGISICMCRKARSILSHSIFSSSTQKTTQVEMQG